MSLGEHEAGLELLERALQTVAETEERCYEAELHRLKGEALVTLGNPREGELEFEQALSVARGQEARLWELRAATSFARLLSERGKQTEARNLLKPVYGWFSEGFDTPDLIDACQVLAALH